MYKGVFVAIITPFKDGAVDEEALRRHTDWLINEGVSGIVPCGTTGEGTTLTHEEYSQVVRAVVSETRRRCPVIAGAGANSTAKAVELAHLVIKAGADATLQVTPYYNKPTQEGLYQHFKTIASEVKHDHILYNVPGRTAVNMLPITVEKLSKLANVVGIKEASGDIKQVEAIKNSVPKDFSILSGNDDQNLAIYKAGGSGAISVTANIAPRQVSEVWNLFSSGRDGGVEELQASLADLNKAMFLETNPIPVKTAASLMGFCREEFRLPMTPIAPENKKQLINILKSYELI